MNSTLKQMISTLKQMISKFHQNDSGQDLLEYALVLVAVLSVVVIGSGTLQGAITAELAKINLAIQGLQVP